MDYNIIKLYKKIKIIILIMYEEIIKENKLLKEEIINLKNQLEKYSNPQKEYYEKNKEAIKEKAIKSSKDCYFN